MAFQYILGKIIQHFLIENTLMSNEKQEKLQFAFIQLTMVLLTYHVMYAYIVNAPNSRVVSKNKYILCF